jgi:hypothetical protein
MTKIEILLDEFTPRKYPADLILRRETRADSSLLYESTVRLFSEHDAETPTQFAREAYDRTECGVWTTFILADGEAIHSSDLTKQQDTPQWAARHVVGIKHGTIVEGSDAEFEADPLMFPFSDQELADAWDYLNEQAEQAA